MRQVQYYVLFPNHENGMRLYRKLKEIQIRSVIAPTPRSTSKCCGISLLVSEKDLEMIRSCARDNEIEILDIAAVEKDINPGRDRYC